jgi:thiol:disulfide interchange protein
MQTGCIKQCFFFVFIILLCCSNVHAQKSPVHFNFSTERKTDSLVYLVVKAKTDSGFFLFSAKAANTDDVFISQLNLDSNSVKYLADTSIVQSPDIQFIKDDKTSTSFHGYIDSAQFRYPLKIKNNDSILIKGSFTWLGKQADEFPSGEENFEVSVQPAKASISGVIVSDTKPKSWLSFFWIGLVAGLIAVFMPCLYPLFPVTITYFMHHYGSKKQGRKNALFYSLCIILIYGIPTTLLTLIFGDTALYKISINPITNLLFFAIFIIFALSFFGLFEIMLPSSWSTQTDKMAAKKGYIGIFFMALTLVIVSFSCTGIVAGQLLSYLSSEGISAGPIAGMFGFGTGLALPFTFLARFSFFVYLIDKNCGGVK